MWKMLFCCLLIFLFLPQQDASIFIEPEYQKPLMQVQTKAGIVQGTKVRSDARVGGSYYAYLGIPYGQPPVGPLRFRAPLEAKPWSGVLDARKQGSGCIEMLLFGDGVAENGGIEDCLYLNVFTKYNPKKVKRLLPVMVYFYGGAFISGNSEISIYGPDFLVERNVVLVTFNYRTGIFGFLSTQDMASPGNYGLKDQHLVLKWIQKNIENFGGDPNSVTLFGHSAGAVCVHFHMLSPQSKGLFHKAILESGSVLTTWGSQQEPLRKAITLAIASGINDAKDSSELIERLRQLDSEELRVLQVGVVFFNLGTGPTTGLSFAPTLEPPHKDAFITKETFHEMLQTGEFNKVPVMMGLTSDETVFFSYILKLGNPFFMSYDDDWGLYTPSSLRRSTPEKVLEIGTIVKNYYFGCDGSFASSDIEYALKYTYDEYFLRPIRKPLYRCLNTFLYISITFHMQDIWEIMD
ncbi:hypothetical protein HHI36_015962 [Cryptolaemus montrouzieri]|uniref:Carboxylic ester hydrolase n=1 Tax=Cryptolaemus montrouzieri TaxID=559131 RepID=A0ABD2N8G5_9CUCU